jgi:hypothetical protein
MVHGCGGGTGGGTGGRNMMASGPASKLASGVAGGNGGGDGVGVGAGVGGTGGGVGVGLTASDSASSDPSPPASGKGGFPPLVVSMPPQAAPLSPKPTAIAAMPRRTRAGVFGTGVGFGIDVILSSSRRADEKKQAGRIYGMTFLQARNRRGGAYRPATRDKLAQKTRAETGAITPANRDSGWHDACEESGHDSSNHPHPARDLLSRLQCLPRRLPRRRGGTHDGRTLGVARGRARGPAAGLSWGGRPSRTGVASLWWRGPCSVRRGASATLPF